MSYIITIDKDNVEYELNVENGTFTKLYPIYFLDGVKHIDMGTQQDKENRARL